MSVLTGLFFINDVDVYAAYGAFLCEDNGGSRDNYDALLKAPELKELIEVDYKDEDGVNLPEVISQYFKPREFDLQFAITASTRQVYLQRYMSFIAFLKSGWLEIKVPELGAIKIRVYVKSMSSYSQLTDFNGEVVAKFKVKFREPKSYLNSL
ncbi:MAG: hypothetical protein ACRDDZ_06185 [Marinifilaceae bacterium]